VRRVNPDQLQNACLRLGETVLDPAIWPEILGEISQAVGAVGSFMLQSDVRTLDVPCTASLKDGFEAIYFKNGWHLRDLRASRGVPLLLNGSQVIIDEDLFTPDFTPDEMKRTDFYNDCIRAVGLEWFAAIGFRAGPALWGLSVQRTSAEGPFGKEDKAVLSTLSRRLTEVASLSTAIGRIALTSAIDALDAVRNPAVSIDRFGYVLGANKATESVFDAEIHVKGRRLFVADSNAQSCLGQLIDRFRITPDTAPLHTGPIVVRRKTGVPVIVRILPVHGAARTPFLGARALLTFTPAEPKPGPSSSLLAKTFGLTPAEARLASIISEGISPEKAAEELGIARETARNQLKAIFGKTGTHRQSELVAILARL
jgi:DNA-binding CsgD family transcriptional regulator